MPLPVLSVRGLGGARGGGIQRERHQQPCYLGTGPRYVRLWQGCQGSVRARALLLGHALHTCRCCTCPFLPSVIASEAKNQREPLQPPFVVLLAFLSQSAFYLSIYSMTPSIERGISASQSIGGEGPCEPNVARGGAYKHPKLPLDNAPRMASHVPDRQVTVAKAERHLRRLPCVQRNLLEACTQA